MKRNSIIGILIATATAMAALPVAAAPTCVREGMELYNSGKYSQALEKFAQAGRSDPKSPLVHYYLGLCYQGTNQMSRAKQHFQYVATGPDPALKRNAQVALNNLSRVSSPTAATGSRIQQVNSFSAGNVSNGSTASGGPTASHSVGNRRLKVLYFYKYG